MGCLLCIYRCSTDDTAQYTAVAGNIHGQASSQASIIVKSKSFYPIVLYLMLKCDFYHTTTRWLAGLNAIKPHLSSSGLHYQLQEGYLWVL